MKRSEINKAMKAAKDFFTENGWTLPPNPKWDITDFGLNDFTASGLVLVNLAEEKEYCEKIMYASRNQVTPAHYHKSKKEDIICRAGLLVLELWEKDPAEEKAGSTVSIKVNGEYRDVQTGEQLVLSPGERITIPPYLWHAFYPLSDECMIGEVSTANDDVNDNFFSNPEIGRFSAITEDE